MMFKVLVGTAAVAIIGFVGVFAYERIADYIETRNAEVAARCDDYRAEVDLRQRGLPRQRHESSDRLRFQIKMCQEDGF